MNLSPDAALNALRAAALFAAGGLVALGAAWELWLAPTGRGTLALKVLPLLPAIGGLMRHRLYTYRWLSLLVWLYVAEGAVRAASEYGTARTLALSEITLALLLFVVCVVYVRRRLRRAAGRTA